MAEQTLLTDHFNESSNDIQFKLPPLEIETEKVLSSSALVKINRFVIKGNTVFSDNDLDFIISPYEKRRITSQELHDLKNRITSFYYSNGYVNSGAIIPDQKIDDDNIKIVIIEGTLPEIFITGNTWLKSHYISRRIELATGDGKTPLNIHMVQDRLKMLKQDPRIENISANVLPSLHQGKAKLDVNIVESRPYYLGIEISNGNSPSVGAYRSDIIIEHLNLTGYGDSINLQYGITEGLDTYSARYQVPVNRNDTMFSLEADRSKSLVITNQFEKFDIKGDTTTMGIGVKHPFYKSVSSEFLMGLKFEHRKSNTYMLDRNMSFAKGTDNGESKVSAARFSQEWVQRSLNQVIAVHSTISFGLDILDATKIETTDPNDISTMPSSTFAAWLGQFQWIRRIGKTQLITRLDMRISDTPLLSIEKFSIGGSSTVRGYRENFMTTDNGLVASIELRIPAAHWNIPALTKNQNQGMLYLAPFFDFGSGGNTKSLDPEIQSISSLGLGARWSINDHLHAEIYWGYALRDVSRKGTEYDLQDDGLHFKISANVFE
jgi:hemolysin activation/secretion protein